MSALAGDLIAAHFSGFILFGLDSRWREEFSGVGVGGGGGTSGTAATVQT